MSENGKVWTALIGGVAAGIAIGMFINSEKGKEMASKFTGDASDLSDTIMKKAEELMNFGKKPSDKSSSQGSSNI